MSLFMRIYCLLLILFLIGNSDGSSQNYLNTRKFLIEWRGIESAFRLNEFTDACSAVLCDKSSLNSYLNNQEDLYKLYSEEVIKDYKDDVTICAYCDINVSVTEEDIQKIVNRCATIRTISEIWADIEVQQSYRDITDTTMAICNACMNDTQYEILLNGLISSSSPISHNNWRVDFRRYGRGGRSGMQIEEKGSLLDGLTPLFERLYHEEELVDFEVNLIDYKHKFFYLEDWTSFHNELENLKQETRITTNCNDDSTIDIKKLSVNLRPSRVFFGRIIAEGINYEHVYGVKTRPYIGTTSMDAISSQLAVNAALITPKSHVLDPFAGTGSLPLAAALLGAKVTLSDIDNNILPHDPSLTTVESESKDCGARRKNNAFKRKKGSRFEANTGGPIKNFEFFGVRDKVDDILVRDIQDWTTTTSNKFSHIITDPPFGRRERAVDSSISAISITATSDGEIVNPMGDANKVVRHLFKVAGIVLEEGGCLVFWLPTSATTNEEELRHELDSLEKDSGAAATGLQFLRASRQALHGGLSRWLCTYTKRKTPRFELSFLK